MFCSPFFQLALDGKSEENQGEVLVGTLGWTGNFSFVFEVDNKNELRVISGINPVSYTHLDVYKRQIMGCAILRSEAFMIMISGLS